ncbi:MAG: HD domain-containing protein [Candidatus Pacebacteria bacterium]|nr:HD domain-containing protein [Candidatus Paceibacterota bacterium]
MEQKDITNYIFEMGVLAKEMHNGMKLIGASNLRSVSEHVLRAAQIGYLLTVLENEKNHSNLNPEKVCSMLVFHDNGEIRIGDLHKIASRYIDSKKAEESAFKDQVSNLPETAKSALIKYFEEIEERSTKEGIIAKDADWLETAFEAKEHYDLGNTLAMDWIDNVGKAIETESAKEIFTSMKETRFTDWWTGLKKLLYKKLDGTNISHGEN